MIKLFGTYHQKFWLVELLVIVLLNQKCAFGLGRQRGEHICHTEEVYTELEKTFTTQPVKIRSYNWCLEIPPRCSIYRTEIKEVVKVQNVTKSRVVEHCCDGYAEIIDDNETICKPICRGGCGKGYCEEPNLCICDIGYTGRHCTHRCRHGMWGDECRNRCSCKNGALCDNKTGFCRCVEGWTGESCENPCPDGHYGMMCKSICECSSSKCHPQTGECLMDDSLILFDWTTPSAETNVMRITKERIEASHWLKVENGSIVNETLKSTEGYQILRNEIQKLLQTTEISVEAVNFTNLDLVDMQRDNITLKGFNKTSDSIIIPLNISSAAGTQISETVGNQKPKGNLGDEDSQLIINIKIDHSPSEKSVAEPVSLNATPADGGQMIRSSNTTILTNNENDIVAVLQETSDHPLPSTETRGDLDLSYTPKTNDEMGRIEGSPGISLNTTIVTNHQNDIVAVLQEASSNREDIAEVVSNQTDFSDGFPTKEEASDTELRSMTTNTTILTNKNNEIVAVLQDHSDHPIYVNLMEDQENKSRASSETIAVVSISCLFLALTVLTVFVIILRRKKQSAYSIRTCTGSNDSKDVNRGSRPSTEIQIINEPLPEIPRQKSVQFETPPFIFAPEFQRTSNASQDHYDHPPNNLSVEQLPEDQQTQQLPYNYNFNTFPRKNPTRRYSAEPIYDEIEYTQIQDDPRVGEMLI